MTRSKITENTYALARKMYRVRDVCQADFETLCQNGNGRMVPTKFPTVGADVPERAFDFPPLEPHVAVVGVPEDPTFESGSSRELKEGQKHLGRRLDSHNPPPHGPPHGHFHEMDREARMHHNEHPYDKGNNNFHPHGGHFHEMHREAGGHFHEMDRESWAHHKHMKSAINSEDVTDAEQDDVVEDQGEFKDSSKSNDKKGKSINSSESSRRKDEQHPSEPQGSISGSMNTSDAPPQISSASSKQSPEAEAATAEDLAFYTDMVRLLEKSPKIHGRRLHHSDRHGNLRVHMGHSKGMGHWTAHRNTMESRPFGSSGAVHQMDGPTFGPGGAGHFHRMDRQVAPDLDHLDWAHHMDMSDSGSSDGSEDQGIGRPAPLGFGSKDNDMCMRDALDWVSTDCRGAVLEVQRSMAAIPREEWPRGLFHGPHHHPHFGAEDGGQGLAHAVLVVAGLVVGFVVASRALRRRAEDQRRVALVLGAVHANPEVKAMVEAATGEEVPGAEEHSLQPSNGARMYTWACVAFFMVFVLLPNVIGHQVHHTSRQGDGTAPVPHLGAFGVITAVLAFTWVLAMITWGLAKVLFGSSNGSNSNSGGWWLRPTAPRPRYLRNGVILDAPPQQGSGYTRPPPPAPPSSSQVQVFTGIPVSAPPAPRQQQQQQPETRRQEEPVVSANGSIHYAVTHTTSPDGTIQAELQRLDQPPLPRSVATVL